MGFIPNVYEEHEANPWIRRLAPLATLVGIALMIVLQQFLRVESGATLVTPLPEIQAYENAREPIAGNLVSESKWILKSQHFLKMVHEGDAYPEIAEDVERLEKDAISRVDRFRIAIVVADVRGSKAGVERLEKLEKEVEPGGALAAEIFWMLKRYRECARFEEYEVARKQFENEIGDAGKQSAKPAKPILLKAPAPEVVPLSAEMQTSLISRHGFFGSLALVQGPGRDESARNSLLSGYFDVIQFFGIKSILEWIVGVIGALLLIALLLIQRADGWIEAHEHDAPLTVYLETVAISLLAFCFMNGIGVLLLGNSSPTAVAISEIMIWLLPVCLIWPRLRGVPWKTMMKDLGLHRGEGIFKEVFVGVAVGCTSMLFYKTLEWLLSAFASNTETGPEMTPPGMYDTPDSATWFTIWLGVLGAIVWAPIVEEITDRGALQGWFRAKLGPIPAIVLTAAVFGFTHQYTLDGLLIVSLGGLFFCAVREWRQCLIAPIVMHFMHNAMISFDEVMYLVKLG